MPRVGGRSAYAFFLKSAYYSGVGEAGRPLGKVLLGAEFIHLDLVPGLEQGIGIALLFF